MVDLTAESCVHLNKCMVVVFPDFPLRASAIDTDVTVRVRTPPPLNREKLRTKVREGAARSAANFSTYQG